MKKTIFLLVFTLIFLITGCTTTKEKEVIIQPQKTEEKGVTVEDNIRTRAERDLPENYKPGKFINVVVKVYPLEGTTGVIVEETLPNDWGIIKSTPAFLKRQGSTYKWLIFSKSVEPFEIRYEAYAPTGETGQREFKGVVVTHKEKTLPIEGDIYISHQEPK